MERLKENEYRGSWHDGLPLPIKENFTDEDGLKVVAEQTFIDSELSNKCPVHEVSPIDVVDRAEYEKLKSTNKALQNRCRALTQGSLCLFCPIDCEYRVQSFREDVGE